MAEGLKSKLREELNNSEANEARELKDYFAKPVKFTSNQLREFTDDFNNRNFIGPTHFGNAYRGTMRVCSVTFRVTVKIWNEDSILDNSAGDHIFLEEEVKFLTDPAVAPHPNLPVVVGYCNEDTTAGIVYALKPLDSLHNLITRGDDFGWFQRIKVAIRFARLLQFLHNRKEPYLVRSIDARHIMVDDEYNPCLLDFGLLSGGSIGGLTLIKRLIGMPPGYRDPLLLPDESSWDSDVFCYGIVLIGLLSKRVYELEKSVPGESDVSLYKWAVKEYEENHSLVHKSLEVEPGYSASDANMLMHLAMRCIQDDFASRPTMDEVMYSLVKSQVVVKYGHLVV